jgi:cytoskeletal protein CcmA (bactofilin family)
MAMRSKFVLYSAARKPEVLKRIEAPDEVLQSTLVVDGGTIYARGGIQIDASMRSCRVVAQKEHPIALSVLGRMLNCHIEGQDILIEGDFAGDIVASGDVEITNTARIAGFIRYGGELVIGPLVDRRKLRVQRMTVRAELVRPQIQTRTIEPAARVQKIDDEA